MSHEEEKDLNTPEQEQPETEPQTEPQTGEAPQPTREEELEQQLRETDDRYKRVLAEYQNFRSRSLKERDGIWQDAVASTVSSFLPVIDTLERALEQETDENYRKSLELIARQYGECLEHLGVKPYGQRGDAFDPNLHNAVMMAEDEELEPNTVAEVLLKGYILGERVVRHAMVKVSD